MKKITTLFLTVIILLSILSPVYAAESAIKLVPDKQTYQSNDTVTITIRAENAIDIYGLDFTLEYDPAYLSLAQDGIVSLAYPFSQTDIEDGYIRYLGMKLGDTPGESGNVSLVQIKFVAKKEGSTNIKLTGIEASNSDAELIDINTTANCDITVGGQKEGWVKENNKWYYYKNGSKVTGWLKDGSKWYYLDSSGVMATGWKKISGDWYYLSSSGAMVTGWRSIGGKWYYFSSSGAMKTGWVSSGGKWYFMDSSGAMTTGWQKINGKWYYMDSSGVMTTGWKKISGKWYYMDSSGAMVTGWRMIGGKWYYFSSSGVMQTGWVLSGGKWYYLYSDGSMAVNTTIGGYKLGKDGAMIA